jgi:peptidoglycan-associated lipoprotein
MKLKRLLFLAVVLSASIYLAACASSEPQKETVAPPASEAVQPSPEETAKQEEIEREKLRQEEMDRQEKLRRDEEERHLTEAASTTFIESLEKVYFDFNKSDIKKESRDVLSKNAAIIREHNSVKVVVEGHCDERGTAEYNLALGERRALSVKKYLVTVGVGETNMYTISYGEEKPADPGHNKEAWAKNRRAQFSKEE